MKALIVLLSIASNICVSFCYPSKPLNERSTELAWEAWLLVDQSNRQTDGILRRRITPKSVFIAPTFSPDSLPACADGYKSDMMGRCVKIIKINESVHLDFLLEKLNAQFPDYDEPTDPPTQGPLQLNIPLPGFEDDSENDTDVAIVVTPSGKHPSKHHPEKGSSVKVKGMGGDKFSVESVAALLHVNPEDVEMTTIAQLSTTAALTTTMSIEDEKTTTEEVTTEGTTVMSTTETVESTTVLEGDALYFRI